MFPKPRSDLRSNTFAYETAPLVRANGFREYDARWVFGKDINLMGMQRVGAGLGTLLAERGVPLEIVTGHDFRSYSCAIKQALITGLMSSGCRVHDIGLSITPMAYFAQFALDVPAVAMVTASHNENGWTGVKMGAERPLTFGPDAMNRLKQIVLDTQPKMEGEGRYVYHDGFFHQHYLPQLTDRAPFSRPLKVVVACGNGTAGAFAPEVLAKLGAEIIPMDCEGDATFPRYNPNPEDMKMLQAMRDMVRKSGADVGLGFDGDGDRCGVVDNEGEEIFADKVGVMLARDLSEKHRHAQFVVDVKSTGLYARDPVLKQNRATTEYWKTGHSYIKQRVNALGALAGFEKSGHYFFGPPIGNGYDDGLVSAIAILDMLDRNSSLSMADMRRRLPRTWGSPTMSPACADADKYAVVAKITKQIENMHTQGQQIGDHTIVDLITVNGVRVTTDDGTWGLVRASSNAPELVVVVESPVSERRLHQMFDAINGIIREHPQVGAYNQVL